MVDLNPLHYVNKFNHMFGDTVASGLEFLGISDPAVDPDGVREIAKKWRHLAGGLDGAAAAAEKSLAGVEWEGKAAKAFAKRSKAARKQATDMAHALRKGAKALDDFADKAHEMLSEIGVLLAEIAEFEIAGLALDVLTLGASSVASSLMAGERALKVVALIGRIEEEGTALGAVVRGVLEVIRNVERALKALREVRGVAAAGKMAAEGMKFSAFTTALEDPGAFKDPEKLAGILTEGALMGVGFGVLGKALGKGLKALGPAALAKLGKSLGLDCAAFERLKLRPGFDKLPASIRNALKKFVRDPIDVATGDMALTRTDVTLPGVLPLVLERVHVSSYRFGGWFGPSWASTLDQRIQADEEGFVYAAADGARLCFPVPDAETGEGVRPETAGSRLLLSWDEETDGALRITDPDTGLIHVFHSPVAAAGDMAVDLPLQHIQDRNGNRITVEYDRGDIPARVVHSGGYRIALDHDASASRVTGLRLLDPDAPEGPGITLLTFGYDETGRLTEETNSSGLPLRYTYDPDGRITSWTDRNDTTYWYAYDERGRVTATGGTGGALASTLTYEDATRTTRVTDSLGHTRVYEHNEALRLVRETDPLGNSTHQEWDEDHRLTSVIDSLGYVTRYRYSRSGDIAAIVRPDGREVRAEHNALGLPIVITMPDGGVWRQEYDEKGNRTAVTQPTGATTSYVYDSQGGLRSVTNALGETTFVQCNRAGLLVGVTDPLGASGSYKRDAFGRPTSIVSPLGHATQIQWTVEGKPSCRTAADGTHETWEYDGEGNCVSHRDAQGAVSCFEYSYFDLLKARTDPGGARYEFEHDTELRLTKVTNPHNLTWSYGYDRAGRLVRETDFDDRQVTYGYDVAGRVISRTNALGETSFELNALGQVVRKNAMGKVTSFSYDLTDGLAQASNPDATITLSRDHHGRLREETVNGRTISYEYDVLGRRIARTTPSGARTTWAYDSAGNCTRMVASGRPIEFDYDMSGREVTRSIDGGALTMAHAYDAVGQLSRHSVMGSTGSLLQQREYTYGAGGSLVAVDDMTSGTWRFDLDTVGRVISVQANNWTERYAYDEVGNQARAEWPAVHPGQEEVGARSYVGTHLMSAGRVHYEYDALGRTTVRRKDRISRKPDMWRYSWDAEDRLKSVVTPDGTRWRYEYDPLGRRTAKIRLAGGAESVVERVDFVWDGVTLCEQSTTSLSAPTPVVLTWDHKGLRPIAQTERIVASDLDPKEVASRFFAIVTDLVGAPTELLDGDGRAAWRTRSTVWGVTAWSRDSAAYTPLRFPGQYYDPETGLHYNHFRHYDPETARYSSPDPLGLSPAPNPTTYVVNPHSWVDPLGLSPCPKRIEGGGWDLRGHNPMSVIPSDAEKRILTPDPNGGAQKGVEFKWKDPETGNTVRLRIHDADGTAPAGSNAANGDVYRISIAGKYQDEAGNLYHRQVHNPNSPHYNPDAANSTHIPWPVQFPLPY
ncbi:polymorphic toxin type 30 domain-containing protein [Streptomyces sp. NPDC086766]|uniref:polymorphic toxin type 30 domain-containing protein n=1 Tax=Streptomyces sp. NPDC086766 TaxID=3365754 RepID=UPI0037F62CCB